MVEVPSGDTLLVQVKGVGMRRVRLAGLRAPKAEAPLRQVSRYHLARLAKGQRVFLVLEPSGAVWPGEVTALVEDFAEAQLAKGLGRYEPEDEALLGPYASCRCRRAEARSREAASGLWRP